MWRYRRKADKTFTGVSVDTPGPGAHEADVKVLIYQLNPESGIELPSLTHLHEHTVSPTLATWNHR